MCVIVAHAVRAVVKLWSDHGGGEDDLVLDLKPGRSLNNQLLELLAPSRHHALIFNVVAYDQPGIPQEI